MKELLDVFFENLGVHIAKKTKKYPLHKKDENLQFGQSL